MLERCTKRRGDVECTQWLVGGKRAGKGYVETVPKSERERQREETSSKKAWAPKLVKNAARLHGDWANAGSNQKLGVAGVKLLRTARERNKR